jgi:type IX secretion system PorP/SprF family membrane protein
MKNIWFSLVLLLVVCQSGAQQLPLFTLYDWHRFVMNPAYSSLQDSSAIRATYRQQWAGFSAKPVTFNAGGFGQFGKTNGFSGFVMRDQTGGAYSQTAMQLSFSRFFVLNERFNLSVGAGAWLNQYSFDNSISQLYHDNDPSYPSGVQRSLVPDASAGIMLQGKGLSVGFGAHQLFESSIKSINVEQLSSNSLARHYFAHAAYQKSINQDFSIIPSALIKTTSSTEIQLDVQLMAEFKRFISVGLNYRAQQGPSVMFQVSKNRFMLGYSYDLPAGVLQNFQNGSHELAMGYVINSASDKQDTDKDGVLNRKDKCPDVPGPIENKGCPYGDTDSDGLTDDKDKCPGVNGPAENNGCPWSDTDGDGLTDNVDKCPGEKGDATRGGCPIKDSDNDGIEDSIDNCPNTKGESSNAGCPVVSEVQKKAIDSAIINLEFETGKAVILASSLPALDMLAIMLNDKPDWNLKLEGHTDNVGDEAANLKLSEDRSMAVADYLISKGVDLKRIEVIYYGESKPIATNDTEEGRKANRRVEMNFVFK